MVKHSFVLAVAVLLVGAAPALALPVVSVDMDPGTAGIQSSLDITLGNPFSVDIVVTDVVNLQGFELDVVFDASVLTATGATVGDFLSAPVFTVQNSVGVMTVEVAALTLGVTGTSGSGVLATIGFDTAGTGTSTLDLTNVILAAPFGIEIFPEAIEDGSVTVREGGDMGGAIPEPTGAVTFLLSLVVYGTARRGRALLPHGA